MNIVFKNTDAVVWEDTDAIAWEPVADKDNATQIKWRILNEQLRELDWGIVGSGLTRKLDWRILNELPEPVRSFIVKSRPFIYYLNYKK